MVNGIDKKALFRLKAEPYLKPISDWYCTPKVRVKKLTLGVF